MTQIEGYLVKILAIVAMFLILIAPHEAGHFAFAKLFRVRVIEFSIGLGAQLISRVRGNTLYALRAIPMAGYVRMGGMESGDFDEPNGFHSKPAWQRLLILAGGPLANFLVAMIVVTGLLLTQLNNDPGKIAAIDPNGPAAAAGLRVGDVVTTVNGVSVQSATTIRDQENVNPELPLVVSGHHADGTSFTYRITPVYNSTAKTYLIGVGPARVVTVGTALQDGVRFPVVAVPEIFGGLYQLASGQIPGGFFGPQGLTGPVGIGEITTQAVDTGPTNFLSVVALLSVALGITNLLPFPALDGGRMLIVILEWLRRRPFDREFELNFQRIGLVALLVLAGMITVLDIQRIATGQFPGLH